MPRTPRTAFQRTISFGLVAVPVKAYTATRDQSVRFHQLEKGSGARIRYRKVPEKSDEEVAAEDIESGYEIAPGRYVVVDEEELERLTPETSETIEVGEFVDLHEIDPVFYDRTYWLAPAGEAAARPYTLLQHAMEKVERVGIGTVVVRNKQYLAAIRPVNGVLALSTLRFPDEVVRAEDIDVLTELPQASGKELDMAVQIVEALQTEWEPDRYHDTYRETLRHVIEQKDKGEEVVTVEGPTPDAKVLDLTKALEASLEAARKGAASNGKNKPVKRTAKRQPAKRAGKATAASRRRKSA